ncbi:MAG: hypothetical protein HOJ57_02465 [Lentisphaerae bacterium]|nr:hypothetical protein [Lentisphaerota bacterium]MBT5604775.1 hypothetical protein [Lentisphaerota bacterium]
MASSRVEERAELALCRVPWKREVVPQIPLGERYLRLQKQNDPPDGQAVN